MTTAGMLDNMIAERGEDFVLAAAQFHFGTYRPVALVDGRLHYGSRFVGKLESEAFIDEVEQNPARFVDNLPTSVQ